MNLKFLILTLCTTFFIVSCKKHDGNDVPAGNVCDITQSLLTKAKIFRFQQGELPRTVISTSQYANGILVASTVLDSSSVIQSYYYEFSYPTAGQMITVFISPYNNLHDTTISYLNNVGDIDSFRKYDIVTKYSYNSSRQLTTYTRSRLFGPPPVLYHTIDSVHYSWQGNNVMSLDYYSDESASGTWSHSSRVVEYYPNFSGKQFFVPSLPELYNLCICPNLVLPSNFVKNIKYYDNGSRFLGEEFFQPVFDAGNKLTSLSDITVFGGDTASVKDYSFEYQCK